MKIALIGYGKMGHAIEDIARTRGHEVVLKVSIENVEDNTIDNIRKADTAIEFTGPHSAFDNIIPAWTPGCLLSPARPAGWTGSLRSENIVAGNKAVSCMPAISASASTSSLRSTDAWQL